ncbi:MAG: cation-translocating P-type ATPase, partial [Planctomycetota bacterium]
RAFDEFDDPRFLEAHASGIAGGQMEATLQLRGVHCAACVWLVERLGRVAPGVVGCRLDFRRAIVTVRWDPAVSRLSGIARALDSLGYEPQPPRASSGERERRVEDRRHLVRVGVAGAIAGNVMLLSIALYAGLIGGIAADFEHFFRLLSAALGVLSLVWPGRVFFRGAVAALRTRAPHLDVPIALALLVGGVWGSVNAVRGTGEVYFDSITVLVFLLLVGRWLQHTQQRRAADAIELLFATTPGSAHRVIDRVDGDGEDLIETVASDALEVDDQVEIRAGEAAPADGELLTVRATFDEALVSGESEPRRLVAGDSVVAGAVNTGGVVRVRVTAAGGDTRVAKLMRLVSDAAGATSSWVQGADRIAGVFVVVVATLAVLTGAGWSFVDPAAAVEHATALLIVSCPCALGLATPLVLTSSIGRLARRGVLVRGGDALERLAEPGVLLLDKTGTVTVGGLGLVSTWGDADGVRASVLAIERQSSHRVAEALVAGLSGSGGDEPERLHAEDVRERPGLGVVGAVSGQAFAIGTEALMREHGAALPDDAAAWAGSAVEAGEHPVLVARGRDVVAGFALRGDIIREDAASVIDELRGLGWEMAIVSGDRPVPVERAAGLLGLDAADCEAGVTPERKLDRVREEQAKVEGTRNVPVVMVGDGVNDAAALAAADVGVAVHGGAEASLQAADVSISRPGLSPLAELIRASAETKRRIKLCMTASLTYNAIMITLAMAGVIHPLLAAVLMPVSSISVVAIAASGRRGRDIGAPNRSRA